MTFVAKTKALISCAVTAPLSPHMQIVGFLIQWLKFCVHEFIC